MKGVERAEARREVCTARLTSRQPDRQPESRSRFVATNAHRRVMTTTTNDHDPETRSTNRGGTTRARSAINPLLLTIPEAAQVLAVGRTTMYELIGAGEIGLVRIGRSVRVSIATLEGFVAEREDEARATVRTPSLAATPRRTPSRR